jgi:hypothetical protein
MAAYGCMSKLTNVRYDYFCFVIWPQHEQESGRIKEVAVTHREIINVRLKTIMESKRHKGSAYRHQEN